MDKILNELQNRKSIRKFKSTSVSNENLLRIIEAARIAPSGSNTQPWRFLIIQDNEMKKKIVACDHHQEWMLTAPVFIVCLADINCRINDDFKGKLSEDSSNPELKLIIRDTAIAITHMLIEAEHLGLSTCWTGWFEQAEMKAVIHVPDSFYVCGVLPIGYADEHPNARPRKDIDEIVRYEKW